MFSMKNIKATFIEKVKNGETKSEKALGVVEIVGKTAAAGATALVYNAPDIAMAIINDKINEGNKRMARGQMSNEEAERFSELSSQASETISNFSENRPEGNGFFHFLSNQAAEEREVKSIKRKIFRNYGDIIKEMENIFNNEEKAQQLIDIEISESLEEKSVLPKDNETSSELEKTHIEIENSEEGSESEIYNNFKKIDDLIRESDKLEERLKIYGEEISEEEFVLIAKNKNNIFELKKEFCKKKNIVLKNKIQELSENQENTDKIELLKKLKEENLDELKENLEILSKLKELQKLEG